MLLNKNAVVCSILLGSKNGRKEGAINIYINQFANIRWNNCFSSTFAMTNGVRQGAILSGFAYCFYMNNLFSQLRKNKSGCWVRGTFLGILGYSDDSLLLAPSLDTLQEMLKVCEEYAGTHNLRFSTDKDPSKCKTKCIAFLTKDRPLPQMKLCGNSLPWVSSGKHLGVTIGNKIDGMRMDLKIKRADYINKNNDILQEFGFCHPKTKIRINSVYNSHLSGSCLWDLFSKEAVQMENTWNVSIRLMLDLPRETQLCWTVVLGSLSRKGSGHKKKLSLIFFIFKSKIFSLCRFYVPSY